MPASPIRRCSAIGEIIHDIDLKDGKYGREEAAGVRSLIAGIAASSTDDEQRLARGAALLDDLYSSFAGRKDAADERPRRSLRRGDEGLGARRRAVVRRPGRPDRGDASHHRRGEEVDRRAPVPAGAELLHPAARPRGAAARDLYRLADAQDQGRAGRRHPVRAAGPDRDHGAELDLRAARQDHGRAGPVLRAEGRRAGDRDRGGAAGRQARAQEQHHAWRSRRRPSSRSSSTTCRSRSSSSAAGAASAGWAAGSAGSRSWPAAATARWATSRSPTPIRCSARRRPRTPGPTCAGRSASARCSWRCGWCRWRRSTSTLGGDNVFTQIALFFSKMAVVTFGGAYAVLAYVAQQAVDHYHWVKPGEMLDGLGMAETTPGPLIMVTQFVGFLGAWRAPGALQPVAGRHAGRAAHHLGHLHALLPLDLLRRALRRGAARQQGAGRGARRGHRGGGRRDPEPRRLVCAARAVRRAASGALAGRQVDVPVLASANMPSMVLAAAAAVAVFRFKVGMVPVLLASSLAGVVYFLVVGECLT